jgi:hypothetical protein
VLRLSFLQWGRTDPVAQAAREALTTGGRERDGQVLLRNYDTYLHEVESDLVDTEACYARGLLASPDDIDLLSLYGHVIWEVC